MKTVDLYDKDFSEWALRNAELVRAGQLDEADLVHIAEEIEDLSKSRQRALQSAVTQIITSPSEVRYAAGAANP